MKKMHVKRGDVVKVISGKDKGKEGKIITAIPEKNKVVVEGVALVKKHQKARRQGEESGIIKVEAAIDASNVMRVCPKCGEPYHTEFKIPQKDGICDRCGSELIIRKDDEAETVLKRLTVYHDQTAPLIDHYKAAGKLIAVDGTKAVEAVTQDIVNALNA